jgi:uncharacterized membrane protein
MAFQDIVEFVAHGLEAMGIVVMAAGGLVAMVSFVRRLVAAQAFEAETGVLRERLARATLLGLEFLVAADIIGTVAAVPTPARLLMLSEPSSFRAEMTPNARNSARFWQIAFTSSMRRPQGTTMEC